MAATSTAKKSSPAPRMPIEDYDRLSVKAIVPHLMDLTGPQLQAVVAHEKAGKNRVTLLQAVRKLELAREAVAHKSAPPSHLSMVEDAIEEAVEVSEDSADESFEGAFDDAFDDELDTTFDDELDTSFDDELDAAFANKIEVRVEDEIDYEVDDFPVVEPIVVAQPASTKRRAIGGVARSATSRSAARAAASEAKAKSKAKAAKTTPEPEALDELEAEAEARPRPPVKAATWEEELRPQLPRRIESSYDLDFEPPVVALAPPIAHEPTSGTVTPILRATGVAKVRKKFESVALVMAAILAILLGLAIGTVLARTGSVSAQPSSPPAVTQTAATPGG